LNPPNNTQFYISILPFKHHANKTASRLSALAKKRLTIAIPASIISDTPHLREKTSKIGLIGRAAAIFRVDQIIVYSDISKASQLQDMALITLLLNYLETPQYLRKALFKIEPDLQYAGILPPLRTPHHPISGKTKHLKIGEYREGLVLSETKEGLLVDIGVQQTALIRQKQFGVGDRLTTQVVNLGEKVEVQAVNREQVPLYWGYKVCVEKQPFSKMLKNSDFDLKIATARIGNNFSEVAGALGTKWGSAQNAIVVFGAPSRGLHEIVEDEGLKLEDIVDFTVNTVPQQGTATVRAEEALLASLAIFNVYFNY
jgi:methyltransferase